MKQSLYFLLLLCGGLSSLLQASAAEVERIEKMRTWRSPERTRIVFDLNAHPDYRLQQTLGDLHITLHFDNVRLAADPLALRFSDTPVRRLRVRRLREHMLRVDIHLHEKVRVRHFVLSPKGPYGHRLVLDLYDLAPPQPLPVKTVRDLEGKRDVIVAIDAGHGGEDPGAIGHDGTMEKDLVLKLARELKRQLDGLQGFATHLLRDDDYQLLLTERRGLARNMDADLMLSIHADAFDTPFAHGSSVYALSLEEESSPEAGLLARYSNASDLMGGVNLGEISRHNPYLASTLLDLAVNSDTLINSLEIGDLILNEMGKISHLHKPAVERAAFAVLKLPDVPALLIESGFISNPEDLRRLRTPGYRRKLVAAIVRGTHRYFLRHPPVGTLLAWNIAHPKQERQYIIKKGDTLSSIALQYGISIGSIKRYNGLQDSAIRSGQTLLIPPVAKDGSE